MTPATERVAVLLDYQNVHLVGHGLYGGGLQAHRCVPNPSKIADIIQARRARPSQVTAIKVYRGRPDPNLQPLLAASNDSQTAAWSRDSRVQVIRRQLSYRNGRAQEKGIDVAIAVDMVHLAIRRQYDAIVLFSGDTDLMPAIELIRQLNLTHSEVACWSGHKPLRMPGTNLPYCHFLSAADWQAVAEDWEGR